VHSCDAAIFDTLPGLVIGIAVSMLLLLHRVSRPHVAGLAQRGGAWLDVERHDDLELNPEVLMVRVESSVPRQQRPRQDRIEALRTPTTMIVVLDAESNPFIDISAAEMLAQLAATLRRDGIEPRIARDIGQFRDVMRSAVPEGFHHEVFRTIDEAINAAPEAGRDGPPDATRH
jgi:MFS superfamily sulfate permease-like transporter